MFYSHLYTVKPVLSDHSKIDKTKILKTNGSLMKVESIAVCSLGAFCNTFDLYEAIIGIENNQFLCSFWVAAWDRFYCIWYHKPKSAKRDTPWPFDDVHICQWCHYIACDIGQVTLYKKMKFVKYVRFFSDHFRAYCISCVNVIVINIGVARTLEKFTTSKGDYWLKQCCFQLCPFSKWERLLKERICSQGERILSFTSSSLWYDESLLPDLMTSLKCYYLYYARV